MSVKRFMKWLWSIDCPRCRALVEPAEDVPIWTMIGAVGVPEQSRTFRCSRCGWQGGTLAI